MKKYIIAEKRKDAEVYLMDFISIPMFGNSPSMTKHIKDAKVYTDKQEATRDMQEVDKKAYLLEIN